MRTAISVVGRDRPGIISSLTRRVVEVGANIEDASMTILQGNFAMILVIEAEPFAINQLHETLKYLSDFAGFTISFSEELTEVYYEDVSDVARYTLHMSVNDTLGIVAGITEVLAQNNANIVDCTTRKNNSTGVFTLILDVDVPQEKERSVVEDIARVSEQFSQDSGDVIFIRVDDIDL